MKPNKAQREHPARQLALPLSGRDGGAARASSTAPRRVSAPAGQAGLPFEGASGPDRGPARLPGVRIARDKAQALSDDLRDLLEHPVRLTVTDNRSSLVTVRWDKGAYHFRVHHMFLDADAATREALASFGTGKRKKTAGRILDAWIEAHRDRIKDDPSAGPRAPAPPQGRHHDLQALFDRLNAEYFDGRVVARIGWGENRRARRRRRRRSIKMGSYVHEARLIRIHPALDRADVPEYYVAWVVYHEMLHQVVPPVKRGGRTYYHPPQFRRLEKAYHQAELAQAWENAHFELLLEA